MLADILLVAGPAAGVLTLADMFLTPRQKNLVSDLTVRTWYWLDTLRGLAFLNHLERTRFRHWMSGAVLVVSFIVSATVQRFYRDMVSVGRVDWSPLLLLVLANVLALVLVYVAINYVAKGKSDGTKWRRLALVMVCSILPAALAFLIFNLWPGIDTHLGMIWVYFLVIVAIFWMAFILILICLMFIYITRLFLYVAELIVRSIAQYDKGPLIACSVVATALGGLVKALG